MNVYTTVYCFVFFVYFQIMNTGGDFRGGGHFGGRVGAPRGPLYAQGTGFDHDADQRRSSHEGGLRAAAGGNRAGGAPDAGNALGGTAHHLMPLKPIDPTS